VDEGKLGPGASEASSAETATHARSDRGVPAWRRWPMLVLPLFAILAGFGIGFIDDPKLQAVALAVAIFVWIVLVAQLRLEEPSRVLAILVRRALADARGWWAVAGGILIAVLAVLAPWIQSNLAPGGLAFAAGLLLYYLAIVFRTQRRALEKGERRWGLTLAVTSGLLLWPFAVYGLLRWTLPVPSLSEMLLLGFVLPWILAGLYVWHLARQKPAAPDEPDRWPLPAWFLPPGHVARRLGDKLAPARDKDEERETWAHFMPSERHQGWFGFVGAVLAFAAGALIFTAAARVPLERQSEEQSQVALAGGDVDLGGVKGDDQLIRFYAPVLQFSDDERSFPTDALAFAEDADTRTELLDRRKPCLLPKDLENQPPSALKKPCLKLDGPAEKFELGSVPGAQSSVAADEQATAAAPDPPPVLGNGKVYPRIYKISDGSSCVTGPPCRIIDYWLFYAKNEWTSPTSIGTITQTHEGDWEHVAVGIDKDRKPLFVAYSAHCTGTWRPWPRAATVALTDDGSAMVAGGNERRRSHPLVVVARGSHANYATAGRRDPAWSSCESKFDRFSLGIRYLTIQVSAVETTPRFGPIQIPEVVLPLESARRVLSAPWYWGPNEKYRLNGLKAKSDAPYGPDSPALKGDEYEHLWSEIKTWECDAPEKTHRADCSLLKSWR
jgi:hypothetical protein